MSNRKFHIGQKAVFFVGHDHMFDGIIGTIVAWRKTPNGNAYTLRTEGDAREWPEQAFITFREWQQKILSGEARQAIDRNTQERARIRSMYAIFEDGEVRPASSLLQWARWMESDSDFSKRCVARTECGGITVSTVFLALNYAFAGGPPLWFETAIFEGEQSAVLERYTTLEQAMLGHERAVAAVSSSHPEDKPR